ncbi:MAG: endonuclease/exonuclease/phosphatase family protein [Bacteriovoracaceae bacterium]|nr:endonuclease/exonuclease/phosphatase family protein [Bacteriovoracaceae bacterium]
MIRFFILSLVLMTSVQASGGGKKPHSFRIVTTNFENLFDAEHDEGKKDFTYLPLVVKQAMPEAMAWCGEQTGFYREECFNLNWDQQTVDLKVQRIAEVLKKIVFPNLPDVIVVQEVENIKVLSQVAQALGPAFQAVLIEGPDERGIDTGMITRLPIKSKALHTFATEDGRPTRGILEVDVLYGHKLISVFANHWPSQSNPDGNRMAAGETLLKLAQAAQRKSDLVIAAGDFNTSEDDELNALKTYILPAFFDAEAEARTQGVDLGALATYSHKGVWASLDHIFVMKGTRLSRNGMNFGSTRIFTDNGAMIENYVFQGREESRPIRYNAKEGKGYSDHLPLSLSLKI